MATYYRSISEFIEVFSLVTSQNSQCISVCFCVQKIALQFKADLENLTDLIATGDDFRWYIKVSVL